jgi:hypothetical protein
MTYELFDEDNYIAILWCPSENGDHVFTKSLCAHSVHGIWESQQLIPDGSDYYDSRHKSIFLVYCPLSDSCVKTVPFLDEVYAEDVMLLSKIPGIYSRNATYMNISLGSEGIDTLIWIALSNGQVVCLRLVAKSRASRNIVLTTLWCSDFYTTPIWLYVL